MFCLLWIAPTWNERGCERERERERERDAWMHSLFCWSSQGHVMMEAFFCLWMKNAVLVPPGATMPPASSNAHTEIHTEIHTHTHTHTHAYIHTGFEVRQWDYRPDFPLRPTEKQHSSPPSVTWPGRVFVWSVPIPSVRSPSPVEGVWWTFWGRLVPWSVASEAPIIVVCSDQSWGSSGQTGPLFLPLLSAAFEGWLFDILFLCTTNCCVFRNKAHFCCLSFDSRELALHLLIFPKKDFSFWCHRREAVRSYRWKMSLYSLLIFNLLYIRCGNARHLGSFDC